MYNCHMKEINWDTRTPGPIRQAFPDIFDGMISTHLAPSGITGQTLPQPLEVVDIKEACKRLSEVAVRGFTRAESRLGRSGIANTGKAAISLCRRIEHLRESIFLLLEQMEFYSAKVLQRSILDHHLRLLYLYERYQVDKTDAAGTDYYSVSDTSEHLQYARALADIEQILKSDSREASKSTHEILQEYYEQYKNVSMNEIKKKARTFTYRSVIHYLAKSMWERISAKDVRLYDNPVLLSGYSFVYFQLSSYVHGGLHAEKELTQAENDKHLLRAKLKLLAFHTFQTDLISKCLVMDLLSAINSQLSNLVTEMNQVTRHVTYSNLLRWDGAVGTLE